MALMAQTRPRGQVHALQQWVIQGLQQHLPHHAQICSGMQQVVPQLFLVEPKGLVAQATGDFLFIH